MAVKPKRQAAGRNPKDDRGQQEEELDRAPTAARFVLRSAFTMGKSKKKKSRITIEYSSDSCSGSGSESSVSRRRHARAPPAAAAAAAPAAASTAAAAVSAAAAAGSSDDSDGYDELSPRAIAKLLRERSDTEDDESDDDESESDDDEPPAVVAASRSESEAESESDLSGSDSGRLSTRRPPPPLERLAAAKAQREGAADAAGVKKAEAMLRSLLKDAPPPSVRRLAIERLALSLAQSGRWEEAMRTVAKLGCRYTLAREALAYDYGAGKGGGGGGERGEGEGRGARHESYVRAYDRVLSPTALAQLSAVFSEGSAFWARHHYGTPECGYFSYLHRAKELAGGVFSSRPRRLRDAKGGKPCVWKEASLIGRLISAVHGLVSADFPAVKQATAAEWWAHCRPHASGHQMHYDSDAEGQGGVRNPIVSCVLYLDVGGSDEAPVGGPTLVTDQFLAGSEGKLASKGWLVRPRLNRLAVFNGKLLHGVIPGAGPTPVAGGRRITLMIAFWRTIETKPPPLPRYGACMPFPPPPNAEHAAWAAELEAEAEEGDDEGQEQEQQLLSAERVEAAPHALPRVWEDVSAKSNAQAGMTLSGLHGMPHIRMCFST